ncbi:MAG: ATP-binding protein [Anaerolineales bacterium]|nr:ATP-binding protein [Anaerolineales bacterium]
MAEAIRSLTHLLEVASSRRFLAVVEPGDRGLAESLPFPFVSIVGEWEMKLSLLLAVINPAVGGVLLLGPRGTGKTTAVRSLSPLLPDVPRSLCAYGCMPEDVESGGIESICPDCAKKYGQGEPLTFTDRARLIELPLHSELSDVIGGIDERAAAHQRMQIKPGILSHADRNLLYVDEVNLLKREVADAILDAAAQGVYTVRRGPVSATYRSRFILVGSMNPEEGALRPQIADRFGLRAVVRGLANSSDRWEAYQRAHAFELNPRGMIEYYREETEAIRGEILAARNRIPEVQLAPETVRVGLEAIEQLGVSSLRGTSVLFEAARAYAAADGRLRAEPSDLNAVAVLALRMRHSDFMDRYASDLEQEDATIVEAFSQSENEAGS